jgi:hypothetical protein
VPQTMQPQGSSQQLPLTVTSQHRLTADRPIGKHYEIPGSHRGHYEDCCLVDRDGLHFGTEVTFGIDLLLASSG